MSITTYAEIDEYDIANAIKAGDLQLELILQNCLDSDAVVDRLVKKIEALGGTREAGERTAKFAAAMIAA
jgi:hypothetical protein